MPWNRSMPPSHRAAAVSPCAAADALEPLDHRSSLNGPSDATASSSPPPRAAPAVLLWLGRAGLHLPGGIRAPGAGRGGTVGLPRADGRCVRLAGEWSRG